MARRPGRDDDDILDFTDGEDNRGGQGPLLLSIALGLAMVVAILVTGWYFFADSRGPGTSSSGVPVVQADPSTIKSKPSEPGGMEVPNQDKLVYERLGQGESQPQGERLLPPPEKPQAPPKPDPSKMSLATPKPETQAPEPAPPAEVKPAAPRPGEPPAAAPAPQTPVVAAAVPDQGKAGKPEPLKPEKADPGKLAAVTTPAPATGAPATGTLQKPADKPAAAAPASAAAPAAPVKLGKGDFQIQLAALRDIETAQREWSKIAAANKDVLTGLSPDIVRADLGPKGIFFRLRAGLLDEASARRVCEELGKRKIGCMVVHK